MSDFSESDIERARELAPKMDERSLGIFMASGLFDMMSSGVIGMVRSTPPASHRGRHNDVTGFLQRTRKSR